jgi:hypothetical protein
MTTAWAYAARGHVGRAARAHACGTLLAGAALVGGLLLLVSAARGRWLGPTLGDRSLSVLALVAVLVVLAEWAARLALG